MPETRILVVENEALVAKDIENKLRRIGYAVAGVALTGAEAVRMAEELCPHLILMDIKLRGEMDGIEAAGQIHTFLDVPIIYLTAFADTATLQRAKITDPAGYVIKPFEERELQVNIEVALNTHALHQKLKSSEANLQSIIHALPDLMFEVDHQGRFYQFHAPNPDLL